MSFLTDNSREPEWSEAQLKSNYIPVSARKPRYTNENSSVGLPNFGMSPWGIVTGVLNALGITTPIQPTLEWEKILVVTNNGDDSTGTRNDLTKPFRTIAAAMAAAQDSDLVWVQPGNYNENGAVTLLKPNVSLYCQFGAQIFVNEPDANTLQFGGRHGIFGEGNFTFISSTVRNILPAIQSSAQITIEALLFSYINVTFTWTSYLTMNMRIDRISKASAAAVRCAFSTNNSQTSIKVGYIDDSNEASDYLVFIGVGENSSVNIEVDYAQINRMSIVSGFLYTSNNPTTANIRARINRLTYGGGQSFDESRAALAVDAACFANKDYVFGGFETTGRLYRWAAFVATNQKEVGLMVFRGKLNPITTQLGGVIDTLIDFRKPGQRITFDLFVEDRTIEVLTPPEALINASSNTGEQIVTGRLYTERTVPNCPGIVSVGLDTGSIAAVENVTFDDFTIVAPVGAASFRFDTGTNGVPVKNVYTNSPLSADNGGVTFTVDGSITVDSNVR